MSKLIGQNLGRYHILEQLGEGGMATVYKAYDTHLECDVAVKVIRMDLMPPDIAAKTVKRFEREARMLAQLTHPNIVKITDYGENEGEPYLVMVYLSGGTLKSLMTGQPMPWHEAARLLAPIARALEYAHQQGMIHRDVKPSNILITQSGEPMLSDFGVAKLFDSEQTMDLTGTSMGVGTPEYMAPEQATSKAIDARADIYALGVVFFELVTGRKPYEADTPLAVLVKQASESLPRPSDLVSGLPAQVEGILLKALAKKPDDRYEDMGKFASALEGLAASSVPAAKSVPIPGSAPTSATYPPFQTSQAYTEAPVWPSTNTQLPLQEPAQKKPTPKWLWWLLGIGGGAIVLCGGVFLIIMLLGGGGGGQPTPLPPTVVVYLPVASDTPSPTHALTPSPSPTTTVPGLPSIGGADLVAFLSGNDIWFMGVDGSDLHQITHDAEEKFDLQWSPDGQSVIYIHGKCIQSVTVPEGVVNTITCFTAADYLDAFEISPDGKQVAISLNHELYVVPFDLKAIGNASIGAQLQDMQGCFTYKRTGPGGASTKGVRWSNDNKKIAVEIIGVESGRPIDMVRVFDINQCNSAAPLVLDTFPHPPFTMMGYDVHPTIPSFDWDGKALFLLNTIYRYQSGYLYQYNLETKHVDQLDPIGSRCCYNDARWSPDGTYIIFAYQDINNTDKTQLYYFSFGSIGTGAKYTPFNLPADILQTPGDHPDAALRPVQQ
jgi:serine/threonine protein kinase